MIVCIQLQRTIYDILNYIFCVLYEYYVDSIKHCSCQTCVERCYDVCCYKRAINSQCHHTTCNAVVSTYGTVNGSKIHFVYINNIIVLSIISIVILRFIFVISLFLIVISIIPTKNVISHI